MGKRKCPHNADIISSRLKGIYFIVASYLIKFFMLARLTQKAICEKIILTGWEMRYHAVVVSGTWHRDNIYSLDY